MVSVQMASEPRELVQMALVLRESVQMASVKRESAQMALALRVLANHLAQGSRSEIRWAIY
jgi:hypothetical protein